MQLRDYQQRAIESIYDYFMTSKGHPIVVAPTGSGKSVMIGAFIKHVIEDYDNQSILVLSHVKELLEQNLDKIKQFWPEAPVGMYCASLKQRRANDLITVASIQSIYKKAAEIGYRSLILVDECHLITKHSEGMYRGFISEMELINPNIKIIGFTATPFRTKSGSLVEGEQRLFTDICYQIKITELLDKGHISYLSSKPMETQADLSNVSIQRGEFNAAEAEAAFDKESLTEAALNEVEKYGKEKKSWLFFCSGIKHAENVRDALLGRGIDTGCVTSKTPHKERADILQRFKDGRIKALTNQNVLTTGFDAPNIDLVAMLRATRSPGLYIQMLGRGMRRTEEKDKCVILDFAGNIERFGPITHIEAPATRKEKKDGKSEEEFKICPQCRELNDIEATECKECAAEFPEHTIIKKEHSKKAHAGGEIISRAPTKAEVRRLAVMEVRYTKHTKQGSPDSLKVEYSCEGFELHSEWVCLEHPGYPGDKAREWCMDRGMPILPIDKVDYALENIHELKSPKAIYVKKVGKYSSILSHEF